MLRIGLSLTLAFIYLYFMVDLPDAWRHVRHLSWTYLGLLALWITLDRLLMSYKWLLLVRCRDLAVGFWESLRAYYVATFAGCFLPTTVGSDAIRVGIIAGRGRPSALVGASITMERALGFVAASLAAAGALTLLARSTPSLPPKVVNAAVLLLAVSVLGTGLSISPWAQRIIAALDGFLRSRGKALSWIGKFLTAYGQYRHHALTLAAFLLLSLLEQSAPIVGTWLAARSLDINLSLLQAAAVTPLALLASRVPLSVSGFGIIEGFYMVFFPLVGVSVSDAFLLGLLGDISVTVSTLPGAVIYALGGFKTPSTAA